jgi:hypothetical protein
MQPISPAPHRKHYGLYYCRVRKRRQTISACRCSGLFNVTYMTGTANDSCHPYDGGAKFLRNVGSYKSRTAYIKEDGILRGPTMFKAIWSHHRHKWIDLNRSHISLRRATLVYGFTYIQGQKRSQSTALLVFVPSYRPVARTFKGRSVPRAPRCRYLFHHTDINLWMQQRTKSRFSPETEATSYQST